MQEHERMIADARQAQMITLAEVDAKVDIDKLLDCYAIKQNKRDNRKIQLSWKDYDGLRHGVYDGMYRVFIIEGRVVSIAEFYREMEGLESIQEALIALATDKRVQRDDADKQKGTEQAKVNSKPKQEPTNKVILELALAQGITLFTDQHGYPYCRIPRCGHYEQLRIDGKEFGDWLAWLLYHYDGRACSTQRLEPARHVLRAEAKFGGQKHRLENRTAWAEDGTLYYNLTDDNWKAVRITPEGWEIDPTPPILFRRYAHQAAQVAPKRVPLREAPNILARIFDFINLSGRANQLIYKVLLISQFTGKISHPLLTVVGEQGCGKTFALKIHRRLVDPSNVSTLALPWQANEFIQQLAHHWCSFYDNLNSLTDWQQDIICRAVTGEGHTKRALYTNEDDIIFTYRRCIALNGINIVTTRPDLLDRSIIFELETLEGKRQTETQLEASFEELRPWLLGSIFEVLVGALNQEADTGTALATHFRLADWVSWGYRIAEALGGRGDEFVDAYAKAVKSKAMMALELHPLGKAVLTFMADQGEWKGTPTELLTELAQVAENEGIDTNSKRWPGSASWLGRRLKEIKPDLRANGVTYEEHHDGTQRVYVVKAHCQH